MVTTKKQILELYKKSSWESKQIMRIFLLLSFRKNCVINVLYLDILFCLFKEFFYLGLTFPFEDSTFLSIEQKKDLYELIPHPFWIPLFKNSQLFDKKKVFDNCMFQSKSDCCVIIKIKNYLFVGYIKVNENDHQVDICFYSKPNNEPTIIHREDSRNNDKKLKPGPMKNIFVFSFCLKDISNLNSEYIKMYRLIK